MKQILFLLSVLTVVSSEIVAQEPIAIDGKEWNIRTGHYIYFSDIHMWVEGDTIVDGTVCKKLYKHTKQLWEGGEDLTEVGYCYQKGDKYYQNGKLMFDLSLKNGEHFIVDDYITYTVVDTGHIVLKDGVSRKCLTVTDEPSAQLDIYNSDVWIEGVGSLRMGIYSNDFVSAGQMKELIDCSYKGQRIHYHDPVALDGKEWTFKVEGSSSSEIRMWIDGDTIVSDRVCKKLYKQSQTSEGKELTVSYCWQNGKQYWQDDKLLFDFGLDRYDYFFGVDNKSDNVSFRCVMEAGDTILNDGLPRRYMIVSEQMDEDLIDPENTDIWVEGVGSLYTGIFDYNAIAEGQKVKLLNCTYNGLCIYQTIDAHMRNVLEFAPSVVTPYYDLQGRKVANPTRGIYIKDGKKVIIGQ
ncbi:MAG: hypothetical protein IKV15_10830 [Bacteroidaceae bacterium]|nr:hypothetical protein [Bacteroidaceae bacterium]